MQLVTLAPQTPWAVDCFDVRTARAWAEIVGSRAGAPPPCIIIHHTGSVEVAPRLQDQLNALHNGLPHAHEAARYHFVVFSGSRRRIWYLNDESAKLADVPGPQGAVHIGAWGDFWVQPVAGSLVYRLRRLCNALRLEWDHAVPISTHMQVEGSDCPGWGLHAGLLAQGVLHSS